MIRTSLKRINKMILDINRVLHEVSDTARIIARIVV